MMVEPEIKGEPRSRASSESGPVPNRVWSVTPEPQENHPQWRNCSHLNLLQQIEIKEQAVKDAVFCLREIEESLKQHSSKVTSSQKWLDRINTIRENKQECRVLIGFLGASGAGKSSLINALLEQDDLLPADDEKACTAVCVEIAYNHSKEPDQAFLAKVDRISEDDWRVELDKLFKDLSDQALNKDGENGEPDLERDMRIKAAFQKMKCVYPHIKTVKDLQTYNVSNLLIHPNVKGILGKNKVISDTSLEGFALKIKPFIDSSNSKEEGGKSFAQWPLVKLVLIKVKSPVLMNGIVLVDLPGSMDTNVARGAIAEGYQKNLKVTCVVAPTQRAASDKPAQDLLGRVTQRTLQLDNHFSTEHLCFIVSKTDSSLNVQRYIRTHPKVEELLGPEFQKEQLNQDRLNKVNDYCARRREIQATNKELVASLNKELKQLPTAAVKNVKVGRPKKRKRGTDGPSEPSQPLSAEDKAVGKKYRALQKKIKEAKTNFDVAGSELYKGQEKLKQVEDAIRMCESRQKAACIKSRNEVSTQELRHDYENASKQMGSRNQKPLQVFCVSALAFADMKKGAALVEGFLKLSDTGVPKLQRWLTETTLSARDRSAIQFLEDVVSLELSMEPWIADTSAEFKMAQTQRELLEDSFDLKFDRLSKDFTETHAKIISKCDKIVEEGIFSRTQKIESHAASESERTVKSWAQQPVYWSTHRALNRNKGEWKTHKGVQYNWNDDLAGNYLEPLVTQWTRVIHSRLPGVRSAYYSEISTLIANFVASVATDTLGISPEMSEAVGQWKESSLRTLKQIEKHSLNVFDGTIQDSAREAHRTVKPLIMNHWSSVYEQCGTESGTGHFKRNQLVHIEYAQKTARRMYQRGTRAIQTAFKKLWDDLPSEFVKGTDPAAKQMREEFETMLNNHTLTCDKETSEKTESAAKAQLQQDVQASFKKLKFAWAKRISLAIEDEDRDPKEEEVNIDDLFASDVDSDILSLSSDSDDDEPAAD